MSTSCQDQKCHEEKVLVADKVKDLIENCEEQKVFNKKVENHFIHYIKKPSAAVIIAVATLILVPLYSTGVKVWFTSSTASYVYAKAETVSQQEKRLSLVEEKLNNMNVKLDEIKETAKENKEDTKEQLNEIKTMLNQLVKPQNPRSTNSSGTNQ
jgi:hypothetical protein